MLKLEISGSLESGVINIIINFIFVKKTTERKMLDLTLCRNNRVISRSAYDFSDTLVKIDVLSVDI